MAASNVIASSCWLWSPCVIGQTSIFSSCGFFFFFMAALRSRCGHYIFALSFLSIFLSFIFLAQSQRPQLECLPYTWCGPRMQVWNVLHAARCKCMTQKSRKKSPSGHHRTTLSGYIFAGILTIGKKLVKQQCLPHTSSQYGELQPTSGWYRFVSLGHPR